MARRADSEGFWRNTCCVVVGSLSPPLPSSLLLSCLFFVLLVPLSRSHCAPSPVFLLESHTLGFSEILCAFFILLPSENSFRKNYHTCVSRAWTHKFCYRSSRAQDPFYEKKLYMFGVWEHRVNNNVGWRGNPACASNSAALESPELRTSFRHANRFARR